MVKFEQQLAPQVGRRVGQGDAGDGDHRHHLGRRLLRQRFALDDVDHAEPGRHGQRGQHAQQQEGTPEQAAGQRGRARQAEFHRQPGISAAGPQG
jgi:hypothetical protein